MHDVEPGIRPEQVSPPKPDFSEQALADAFAALLDRPEPGQTAGDNATTAARFAATRARIAALIKPLDANAQADKAAAAALDAAENELRTLDARRRYFGDDDSAAVKAWEEAALAALRDAEFAICEPDGRAFQTLPLFPRYLYLVAQLFRQAPLAETQAARATELLARANIYLDLALESAFEARKSKIERRFAGAHSELAYVFDTATEESLTDWVVLTDDNAPTMNAALELMRSRVASAYTRRLPFEALQAALARVSKQPASMPVDDLLAWLAPETIAADSKQLGSLLLPAAIARYAPELATEPSRSIISGDTIKNLAQEALSGSLTELMSKKASKTMAKLIKGTLMGGALGALSPAIGIVLNAIFPSEAPITQQEMEDEIKRQILRARIEDRVEAIENAFEDALVDYQTRMSIIEGNNSGVAQQQWNLGTPEDWESVLSTTRSLETLSLVRPTQYEIAYHIHKLVPEIVALRLTVVYGALQAAGAAAATAAQQPGASPNAGQATITVFKGHVETTLQRWYAYLERLADHAYGPDVRNEDDFRIQYTLFKGWRVLDKFRKDEPLSGLTGDSASKCIHRMVTRRYAAWICLNTTILGMCQAHDKARQEYIAKFSPTNLPIRNAVRDIYDGKVAGKYRHELNSIKNETAKYFSSGGAYKHLAAPGLKPSIVTSTTEDYTDDDLYVQITTSSGEVKRFGTGDFFDLVKLSGVNRVNTVRVPRGFVAIFYESNNCQGRPIIEVPYNGISNNPLSGPPPIIQPERPASAFITGPHNRSYGSLSVGSTS
jgi:hypothetical protein